jgi:hypothetical protein
LEAVLASFGGRSPETGRRAHSEGGALTRPRVTATVD